MAQTIVAANKHKRRAYLSQVPRDVFMDILSRVPAKFLCRCRCVCKGWRALLLDPEFAKFHFTRVSTCILFQSKNIFSISSLGKMHSIDIKECFVSKISPVRSISRPDIYEYELLGSCNGFVLFKTWNTLSIPTSKPKLSQLNPLYISNPLTKECVGLPRNFEFEVHGSVYGFGFSPKTKQYKVIRILSCLESLEIWSAKLCILGKGTWRNIGEVPYNFHRGQSPCSYTYLDGVLHWLAAGFFEGPNLICSFDLENEQFQSLPLPPGHQICTPCDHILSIGVLGGCLCALAFTTNSSHLDIEIWVMKNYGIRESWVKEHVFEKPLEVEGKIYHLKLIRVMDNGEILFSMYSYLFCYSPKDGSWRRLEDISVSSMARVVAHFPSFISLYDTARIETCKRKLIGGISI